MSLAVCGDLGWGAGWARGWMEISTGVATTFFSGGRTNRGPLTGGINRRASGKPGWPSKEPPGNRGIVEIEVAPMGVIAAGTCRRRPRRGWDKRVAMAAAPSQGIREPIRTSRSRNAPS